MDASTRPDFAAPPYRSVSPARTGAMVLRYLYLLKGSWPRVVDLVYWPTVQMLMWGFLQLYLSDKSGYFAQIGGTFIGAILLWDILFRSQLGFSISFMEEMWSRNMGHLMVTPLRPSEFAAALMAMSVIRLAIGLVPVSIMAVAFFGFNLWGLGLALVAFFVNLFLTSWAIGLAVSGLILRYGLGAEGLAWSATFLLLPLTAVYYPVSVLPEWLQWISLALAPTYVFEGMRALMIDHTFHAGMMVKALALNLLYFGLGFFAFLRLFDAGRRAGSILQLGE
ncbi:ABC transporter permease [Microbaculum marinisediminis]|uniref:ABC transporter permease n=1 Tax=Microbaculum marinisediminis TaxID=2931392 RepID=A0AAW5QYW1_9HYPH|nr:ABC transporter permease [Microbaculum sp. A6E488]MCT8973256.1 ABC transporter permease [Microbaculum sp. A6E488]